MRGNLFTHRFLALILVFFTWFMGPGAHAAIITLTGTFEVDNTIGSFPSGLFVPGDSFSFNIQLDDSTAGSASPLGPDATFDYFYVDPVISVDLSADPGNIGTYTPSSLTLTGSEIYLGYQVPADVVLIVIFLDGIESTTPMFSSQGIFLNLRAFDGAIINYSAMTTSPLSDAWFRPPSLADLQQSSLGGFYEVEAPGPFGSVTALAVVPEPGLATLLVGAGALGLLMRRRSLRR